MTINRAPTSRLGGSGRSRNRVWAQDRAATTSPPAPRLNSRKSIGTRGALDAAPAEPFAGSGGFGSRKLLRGTTRPSTMDTLWRRGGVDRRRRTVHHAPRFTVVDAPRGPATTNRGYRLESNGPPVTLRVALQAGYIRRSVRQQPDRQGHRDGLHPCPDIQRLAGHGEMLVDRARRQAQNLADIGRTFPPS